MHEIYMKLLWILTYAAVVGSEKENDETAVMAANTAVARFNQTWHPTHEEAV